MSKLNIVREPGAEAVIVSGGLCSKGDEGLFIGNKGIVALAQAADPITFIKELSPVSAGEGFDQVKAGTELRSLGTNTGIMYFHVEGDSIVFTEGYRPEHLFTIKSTVDEFVSMLADARELLSVEQAAAKPAKAAKGKAPAADQEQSK